MTYLRQLAGRLRAPVKPCSIGIGFTCSIWRPRPQANQTVLLSRTRWTPPLQRHISALSTLQTRQKLQSFTSSSILLPKTQTRTAFYSEDPKEPRRRKAVPVFENQHDDPRLRDARPIVTPDQIKRFYRSPSLHGVVVVCFLAGLAFFFTNIETVPVSGRRRFNCHSDKAVQELSEEQFKVLLKEFHHAGVRFLSPWDPRSRMVKRVMDRLEPVSGMDDVEWEIFVIDEPANANAFVLPCGKVFVFSGIFRHLHTEDALAAVLGHEIAHNLANHAAEQMSASIGTNFLFWSLAVLSLGFLTLPMMYGGWLGGRFFKILFESPMSRMQETEADQIGLLMMAEACYDPRYAVSFWESMLYNQGTQEPPEWLSTHPSHKSRIENIQKMMPMAIEKREQSDCKGTQGFAEAFKRAMRRGEIIAIYPTTFI